MQSLINIIFAFVIVSWLCGDFYRKKKIGKDVGMSNTKPLHPLIYWMWSKIIYPTLYISLFLGFLIVFMAILVFLFDKGIQFIRVN